MVGHFLAVLQSTNDFEMADQIFMKFDEGIIIRTGSCCLLIQSYLPGGANSTSQNIGRLTLGCVPPLFQLISVLESCFRKLFCTKSTEILISVCSFLIAR